MHHGKTCLKETKTWFKFDLKASNGQNILSFQGYKSKASCIKGIESVIPNAAKGNVEEELT